MRIPYFLYCQPFPNVVVEKVINNVEKNGGKWVEVDNYFLILFKMYSSHGKLRRRL